MVVPLHVLLPVAGGAAALPEHEMSVDDVDDSIVSPGVSVQLVRRKIFMVLQMQSRHHLTGVARGHKPANLCSPEY